MRSSVYSSRYFIVIGLFIFLCFTLMGLFMIDKFNKRTDQISIDMATKVYQLKSNVVRSEFNGFMRGLRNTDAISSQITKANFGRLEPMAISLLLSHPKINSGWYAIADQNDTIVKVLSKAGKVIRQATLQGYQQRWIKKELTRRDTITYSGTLINHADSLHWLVASKHLLSDSSVLIFGLDINLKELQHYLWSVDTTGRAYAFLADKQGYYITNQEEKLIGTKMPKPVTALSGTTILGDSISSYETVNSTYLQLPVIRYYTPLKISGMDWTMVVDTPVLAVDEDVKAIEKYVMIMFASSAFVILLLIAWAQTKWQKEFMLRQQAEMKRKELSIEKQALSLTAERQQKENAILQLDQLKEKVNPHFLFNSLTSLNGLIEEQPEMAKSFVVKLSRVYRYVLDPAPDGLASVANELRFAAEYFFLLKIRFGDALDSLDIDVSEAHRSSRIPFMSLQTLVENAVKHNVVSKEKPLKIRMVSDGEGIWVINNLQLRNDVSDSGKQGLSYLQQSYAHYGDYQLKYGIQNDEYRCFLPVINISFTP